MTLQARYTLLFPDVSALQGGAASLGNPIVFPRRGLHIAVMPDITSLIQSSAAHAWLYLPLAVLLGALHALEPGHAKSMMAAYIVAVRGTIPQAALLGLSAAVGHTIIVWGLAIGGLLLGEKYIVEQAEPWLTLLSG